MKNVILNKNKIRYTALFIMIILIITAFVFPTRVQAASTYTQTLKSGIEAFPESYQKLLRKFVEQTGHTNWTFKALYTGIDWNDFIKGEAECGRNRVHTSFDTAYRHSCNNLENGYYCADSRITSYFIDPRNFINERNMFQFLETSYDESVHTREIVNSVVKKYKVYNYGNPITFKMSDKNHPQYGQNVTMTFTDIIMEAARISRMSPISMAIKIVQEVGANGSDSVSGTHSQYPNCYNYFNIGAYDTGDAIANGLSYANNKGWHCPYTSIIGGANFNSENYIKAGQNTAYLYKYDCVGKLLNVGESTTITNSNLYHQFMTNIQDPYSQSASLFTTYTNNGLLDKNLSFVIPVFDNMPNVTYKYSSLSNSTGDLYYANVSSSVSTRAKPTTSASIPMSLYRDDLVLMLDRKFTYANGYEWDKVQLWNGQIAYVTSKYLEKFTKQTTPPDGGGEVTPPVDPPVTPPDDTDIEPIPNIGYGYADVNSYLNVRDGMSTSHTIIAKLTPKKEVLILEESGDWYKVRLTDGTIGYAAKEYIANMEYIKVDENNIKILPQITSNIVAGKLNLKDYQIKKGDTVLDRNTLGTGYKIISNGKEYTIIKLGDTNGDGEVDIIDMALIKRDIMNTQNLAESYLIAGNLDSTNTEIDIIDLALIKRHLVGTQNIKI